MTGDPLADLTDAQRDAVLHVSGPLLVVAGPGSGKTRVITRRVAHLITVHHVPPERILAITFTNKAAGEMKRRILEMCPAEGAWLRTFHSTCAAILRRWPEAAGLKTGFTIYDTDETSKIVRATLREMDVPAAALKAGEALSAISRWKADGLTPKDALERESWNDDRRRKALVFEKYVRALSENNAVDFDDLLSLARRALETDEHVRGVLQGRFEHVLIDEYQDTSPVQFHLARLLVARTGNLCVVGDPDQSIYAFRKADIRNILDFEENFKGAKVIRLEHNFRSVGTILKAADKLISNNTSRRPKTLVATREAGEKIRVISAWNEREEAQQVADTIMEAYGRGVPYRDFAIFYRVNSQSRAIEAGLRAKGIPYTIVKGVEFYHRAEVKDVLAYLKVLANPQDREQMERVVSTPTRGIGKVTMDRMHALAREKGWTAREALRRAADQADIPARAATALRSVAELLDTLERGASGSVAALMEDVLRLVQFEKYLKDAYGEEFDERWANVRELVQSAKEYDDEHPEDRSVVGFLTLVGLVSDVDEYDPDAPRVPLMTLHSAKGLEFREVILTGLEEGLLPHSRSTDDKDALEEERRLLFVGITRAKERLTLTYAVDRTVRMPGAQTGRSRFLDELPQDVLDVARDRGPASIPRGLGGDWATYQDEPPPARGFGGRPGAGRGAGEGGFGGGSGFGGGASTSHGARPGGGGGGFGHRGAGGASGDEGVDFQPDDFDADVASDDPSAHLRVGGTVQHGVYGRGKVVRLEGSGQKARAVVRFQSVGEKTLALSFAKLTRLD